MRLPLLVLLIFFGALFTVSAQDDDAGKYRECNESQYYRTSIAAVTKGKEVGRFFSLSANSPVTRAIRSNRALTKAINPLYDLMNKFNGIMEERAKNNDPLACNLPSSFRYITNARKRVIKRQFGNFSEEDVCPSRLEADIAVQRNELSAGARDEAYETVANGLEALFKAASSIDVIPKLNWTKPYRAFGVKRLQAEQVCTIDSVFAYRNQSRFYILASVTNHAHDVYTEDFDRQRINEYVPQQGDQALTGPHIKYQSECEFENSTTQLTRWGGPVAEAHGGNAALDDRVGVFTIASRANSVAIDIAEDSLTGSNIAILALPMVMNFVPVAFVADLNTIAMLCYVIITDVFSTIPFFIKGIELILTGSGRRRAMGAIRVGNDTLGQLEIFTADCRGKESYKITGITFVCVALVLLVFGVWLEVYARKIMQRRRQRGDEGPFGDMMDFVVGYGPMGGHPEDEKMKRFTYDMMIEEGIGARDRGSANSVSDGNSMPSFPSRISNGLATWIRGSTRSGQESRRRDSRSTAQSDKRE